MSVQEVIIHSPQWTLGATETRISIRTYIFSKDVSLKINWPFQTWVPDVLELSSRARILSPSRPKQPPIGAISDKGYASMRGESQILFMQLYPRFDFREKSSKSPSTKNTLLCPFLCALIQIQKYTTYPYAKSTFKKIHVFDFYFLFPFLNQCKLRYKT